MNNKRLNIFIGNFGSGKTEISINYALELKKNIEKVAIVDLDVINPFYRTSDVKDILSKKGIRVIVPLFANTNVDVPALSGEVNFIFDNHEYISVIDVGGDDLGATVLARYKKKIEVAGYNLFYVINTRRPMSSSVDDIHNEYIEIARSSNLDITGLVNNTNILGETSQEIVLEGQKIIKEFGEKVNKSIFYTAIDNGVKIDICKIESEIILLEKHIKLPWN